VNFQDDYELLISKQPKDKWLLYDLLNNMTVKLCIISRSSTIKIRELNHLGEDFLTEKADFVS